MTGGEKAESARNRAGSSLAERIADHQGEPTTGVHGFAALHAHKQRYFRQVEYRFSDGKHGEPPLGDLAEQRAAPVRDFVERQSRAGGAPLPESVRASMEPRLGGDLSGVRVHTGAESAQAARALNARAFTVGGDIHFGSGAFAPGSREGDRLIAHELAHVVQGRGGNATKIHRATDNNQPPSTQSGVAGGALATAITRCDQLIRTVPSLDVTMPDGQNQYFRAERERKQWRENPPAGDANQRAQFDAKVAQLDGLLTQKRDQLREWVVLAIQRAVGQLQSAAPNPGAPTPDGVMAAMQRRSEFLDSPAYQRETQRPAGQSPGVRVWGSDSTAGSAAVTPGHIMATDQNPGGMHSSFGPVPMAERAAARQQFAAAGGEPIRDLGRAQPPMPLPDGGRMPPQPVSQMPGRQFTQQNDPYVASFPREQQNRPGHTFSHEFHPDFLPPAAFKAAVERGNLPQKRMDEGNPTPEDARALNYQLMSVAATEMTFERRAQARAAGIMTTTPGPSGPIEVAPERNCISDLLQKLIWVTRPDGSPFITPEDMAMLGVDPRGITLPGHNLPTQALEQHLRFKEHEWRQLMQAGR